MPYAAGTFDFPQTTGDFSVTGLGFQPELLIMFGGNQATEDTLLTGLTRPGIFLSICVNDYASPSDINVWAISIAGNTGSGGTTLGYVRCASQTGARPIRMQDNTGSSGIDYRASQVTFDADGFTLTVSHAAPGNRPIHWWAVDSEGHGCTSWFDGNAAGSFDANFEIKSFIGMNGPASGGGDEVTTNGDSWLHFGTAHYPGNAVSTGTRKSAVTHTGCLPSGPVGREGFTQQFFFNGTNGDRLVFDLRSSGPALADNYVRASPNVLHGDTAVITNDATIPEYTHVTWMGIEGDADVVTTDADVGDSVSVSTPSWFDDFELVMFSTINGAAVTGTSASLRYGLGILHPDYQGCVVFGDDGSFYQSTNKCAARCTGSGVDAAVGTILGSTFELETVAGGSGTFAYHAFGPVTPVVWIPQIYRLVMAA